MTERKKSSEESSRCILLKSVKDFLKLKMPQKIRLINLIFDEGDEELIEMLTRKMELYPSDDEVVLVFRTRQAKMVGDDDWRNRENVSYAEEEIARLREELSSSGVFGGRMNFIGTDGCRRMPKSGTDLSGK